MKQGAANCKTLAPRQMVAAMWRDETSCGLIGSELSRSLSSICSAEWTMEIGQCDAMAFDIYHKIYASSIIMGWEWMLSKLIPMFSWRSAPDTWYLWKVTVMGWVPRTLEPSQVRTLASGISRIMASCLSVEWLSKDPLQFIEYRILYCGNSIIKCFPQDGFYKYWLCIPPDDLLDESVRGVRLLLDAVEHEVVPVAGVHLPQLLFQGLHLINLL